MSIKNEVDIIRKENLKLNKKDTKLVFETLMKVYKSYLPIFDKYFGNYQVY